MSVLIFSRCSLGKGRWYWCIWDSFDALVDGQKPANSGYAPSREDAEKHQPTGSNAFRANVALAYHRRLCQEKRSRKPPSGSRTVVPEEYLYKDWIDGGGSTLHRIIKKTDRFVFVERDHGRCHRLDREKLEREGCVMVRHWWQVYYTTPYEARAYQPDYLKNLGLPVGATLEDIKRAYRRLAKEHHPDRGGNPASFIGINEAYQRALSAHPGSLVS